MTFHPFVRYQFYRFQLELWTNEYYIQSLLSILQHFREVNTLYETKSHSNSEMYTDGSVSIEL
jgi:hypothetical protein